MYFGSFFILRDIYNAIKYIYSDSVRSSHACGFFHLSDLKLNSFFI